MNEVKNRPRRSIVAGEEITLASKSLNEERRIYVHLPSSYAAGTEHYPVLYILDGDETSLLTATGVVAHESEQDGMIPELVIVAVANTNRIRDMTPTAIHLSDGRTHGGGADAFLTFLGDELVPWVDASWRTMPFRILAGTSASGLAVVHASLHDDSPFGAFLASSPTLHWDNSHALRRLQERQTEGRGLTAFLYLFCGGDGDQRTMIADCRAFAEQSQLLDEERVLFRIYKDEGHCPYPGLRDGLLALFDGWPPPSGVVAAGAEAVWAHFASPLPRLGKMFAPSVAVICEIADRMLREGQPGEAARLLARVVDRPTPSEDVAEDVALYYALALERSGQRAKAEAAVAAAGRRFPGSARIADLARRLELA